MEGDRKGEEERQDEEGSGEVEFATTRCLLGCGVEGEAIEKIS